jgi:hypothetical protein
MLFLIYLLTFLVNADVVMQEGESSDRSLFNFQEFAVREEGTGLRGLTSISCLINDDCVTRCNTELEGACGYMKAKNGQNNKSTCDRSETVSKCKCDCESSSCFSHRSRVMTEAGESILQNIQVGDRVQTMSGFEPVIGFLHNSDMSANFLSIKHDQGVLEITDTHLVFLADGTSVPARDLRIGDRLSTSGDSSLIAEINQIKLKGFSSPLTQS